MRVPLPGGACACGFDDPGRFEVVGRREREDDLLGYVSRVIIVASRKLDDVRRGNVTRLFRVDYAARRLSS